MVDELPILLPLAHERSDFRVRFHGDADVPPLDSSCGPPVGETVDLQAISLLLVGHPVAGRYGIHCDIQKGATRESSGDRIHIKYRLWIGMCNK